MRAAEDGAVRRAREQQPAGEQRGQADEQRAGRAEQLREAAAEHPPDEAAVLRAERHHQARQRDGEARAEGVDVQERAAEEHQPADDDERGRGRVGRRAEQVAQARLDLLADHAPRPAEVEERGEEEPDRCEAEPDQLRMLVTGAGAALLLRRPLLHARGRARAQGSLLRPRGHEPRFDAPGVSPSATRAATSRAARAHRARAEAPEVAIERRDGADAERERTDGGDDDVAAFRAGSGSSVASRSARAAGRRKPSPSMPTPTWAFSGRSVRCQRSPTVRPRQQLGLELDLDVHPLGRHEPGPERVRERDGVVDRRAVPAVRPRVVELEELDQLGDERADATGGSGSAPPRPASAGRRA